MTRTKGRAGPSQLRAARVGFLIALLLLISSPIQLMILVFAPGARYVVPRIVFRMGLKIIGLECDIRGPLPERGPALILCNHLSWIDIVVIGAHLPAHFVAKREVAGWPVFGQMARLIGAMFVDRERRTATAPFRELMQQGFDQGRILVLFPEGTSTDGSEVLPFKSALLPNSGSVPVIPLTLSFFGNRQLHPFYAWYDDTSLIDHMRAVFAGGPVKVRMQFADPITPDGYASRKELAARSHAIVSQNLASAAKDAKEASQFFEPGLKA